MKDIALPLAGVRVLAVEQMLAGPYCSRLLAELGAEILKIEDPAKGDVGRAVGPFAKGERGETRSVFFTRVNQGKKSVTLNLKESDGREILRRLVSSCDIFVINSTPAALKQLGLTYAELSAINPCLVYVSITGFGLPEDWGTAEGRKAYDIVVQAMSGLTGVCEGGEGDRPQWLNAPIGDLYSGVFASLGALSGYVQKLRWGNGRLIDISMYDVLASLNERWLTNYSIMKQTHSPGAGHGACAPWDLFKASDGYVAIASASEAHWPLLCRAIERRDLIDDTRFSTAERRVANHRALKEAIEHWSCKRTRKVIEQILTPVGVAVGPVQSPAEIFSCPILRERGLWQSVQDPVLGQIDLVASPLRFSCGGETDVEPSPELGAHTADVLRDIAGLDDKEIERLRFRGVC